MSQNIEDYLIYFLREDSVCKDRGCYYMDIMAVGGKVARPLAELHLQTRQLRSLVSGPGDVLGAKIIVDI